MTNDDDLQAQLVAACASAGIDPADARLIHHYSNAIYYLPSAEAVIRITVGPADLEQVRLTQAVTRWLVQSHGFPATAPLGTVEPVALECGSVASFWEFHEQPVELKYSSTDLAALLHRLHTIDDAIPVHLPSWVALTSLEGALAESVPETVLARDDVAWLKQEIVKVREQLTAIEWQLPPGLVHADAWAGNLLANSRPHGLLLGDWDWVSHGPREVDLVPTWHAVRRYGRDNAWKSAFAAEYGYDLAHSPGYEALMHMRDMMQLTGPLRRASADQRYFTFLQQRFSGIRASDRSSQWLAL
ncbi:aminoglycoside phosphotransferase family protein [Catenulispora sp. NL8]|uniref:Aminoglycoside phosphotransferase family protein n=1 Tax=Catenulispora pinistramenti TaxID=2705254 RepID=A0ABS5KNZ1_9ACTN|nr:phosphotransferase [Catenulispora pinistramenti]MBS2547778.1 aminoglycoside phosphotransferase family protein [Catenulispora pinistramenti]